MMRINFILKASDFSFSELVKWILSVCLKTLTLHSLIVELNGFHDEIRLNKLKELNILAKKATDLKEVTVIDFRIMTTLLFFS